MTIAPASAGTPGYRTAVREREPESLLFGSSKGVLSVNPMGDWDGETPRVRPPRRFRWNVRSKAALKVPPSARTINSTEYMGSVATRRSTPVEPLFHQMLEEALSGNGLAVGL